MNVRREKRMKKTIFNSCRRCWRMAAAIMLSFALLGTTVNVYASVRSDIKTGDVNNDAEITTADVVAAIKTLSGTYNATTVVEDACDVNGDGEFTVRDILILFQTVSNLRSDYTLGIDNLEAVSYDDPVPDVYKEGSSFLTEEEIGFYGADGYGKYATGGRGGTVIEVTNLNDSGEGSLRAALEAEGARIVVFKVSGIIYLESGLTIRNGDITIAGETAPGDGICIANYGLSVSGTENVIIRYIRVRPGDQNATSKSDAVDALDVKASKNVIIDHCSTSWATDETLSVSPSGDGATYDAVSDNVSIQWCVITESIAESRNIGIRHGMGSLVRGAQGASVTYHHNYYAMHSSRMPMIGNYMANEYDDGNFNVEFINNVVYNWSGLSSGKCGDSDENGEEFYTTNINYINNVFKAGSLSSGNYAFSDTSLGNHMYISGNMMNGELVEDQTTLVHIEDDALDTDANNYYDEDGNKIVFDAATYFLSEPFANSEMADIQDAADVEESVLSDVGASLYRDAVDTAVIEAYTEGTGTTINTPAESLGWTSTSIASTLTGTNYYDYMQENYPSLASYDAYEDTDHDGMSDAWEDAMGLDKNDASDGAASYMDSPYTNLDVFLQFLIENPDAAIAQ